MKKIIEKIMQILFIAVIIAVFLFLYINGKIIKDEDHALCKVFMPDGEVLEFDTYNGLNEKISPEEYIKDNAELIDIDYSAEKRDARIVFSCPRCGFYEDKIIYKACSKIIHCNCPYLDCPFSQEWIRLVFY